MKNNTSFDVKVSKGNEYYETLLQMFEKHCALTVKLCRDTALRNRFERDNQVRIEELRKCDMVFPDNTQILLDPDKLLPAIFIKQKQGNEYHDGYIYDLENVGASDLDHRERFTASIKLPTIHDEDNLYVIDESSSLEMVASEYVTDDAPEHRERLLRFIKLKKDNTEVSSEVVVNINEEFDAAKYQVIMIMPYRIINVDYLGKVSFSNSNEAEIVLSCTT